LKFNLVTKHLKILILLRHFTGKRTQQQGDSAKYYTIVTKMNYCKLLYEIYVVTYYKHMTYYKNGTKAYGLSSALRYEISRN